MASQLLINEKLFILQANSRKLKDAPEYEYIRSEIDQKFNPLSGLTNWEKVSHLCESLATDKGIDLHLAIYYTVAMTKKFGVIGLTEGLELIKALLILQDNEEVSPPRLAELVNWLLTKVCTNVRDLEPQAQQIRNFYRCEELCQQLHNWFVSVQPKSVPEFDTLGYILFEHINQLEMQQAGVLSQERPATHKKTRKYYGPIGFFAGAIVGILGYLFYLQTVYADNKIQQLIASPKTLSAITLHPLSTAEHQEALRRYQGPLVNSYLLQAEALLNGPINTSQQQLQALHASMLALYPQDETLLAFNQQLSQTQQQLSSDLDRQRRRFNQVRTHVANLAIAVKAAKNSALEKHAAGFEDYAMSLTPIYGRLLYIDKKLTDGLLTEAEQQLAQLKFKLKAVLQHAAQLERSLQLHTKDSK